MGSRGPVPKPTALHVLRGSKAQYDRAAEPPTDGKKPRSPTWLKKSEQRLFRKIATQLHAMGCVGTIDAAPLGRYVRLLHRWLELEEFLEENGQTYVKRGRPTEANPEGPILEVRTFPHAREARNLAEKLLQLEREFGMTPAGRARLAIDLKEAGGADAEAGDGKSRFLSA